MKSEVQSPRRLIDRDGIKIIIGGRPYLRDGTIKQSAVHVRTTIEDALKRLEDHEKQFEILPITHWA